MIGLVIKADLSKVNNRYTDLKKAASIPNKHCFRANPSQKTPSYAIEHKRRDLTCLKQIYFPIAARKSAQFAKSAKTTSGSA